MMTIDLSGITKAMNPAFLKLVNDNHRKNVLVGGAASGKSYDTAEKVLYKMLVEPGHRFLIVRKVGRTLKHSVWDLLNSIIADWNMTSLFSTNKTDLSISCKVNKNEILFTGLDDVEKLKSVYGITDIWIEEASEISEGDFNQLDLRLRGHTAHKKQITMTLNPISALHWIKKRFFGNVERDTLTHRSTYLDNKHLDQDTIDTMEAITDPYFKDVYVLGNWGVLGNVVFSDYIIEDFDYNETDLENVCQGQDYGFAHASAIIRLGFKDDEIYIFDEVYGKGWTNGVFIEAAEEQLGPDAKYYQFTGDSAEPDRIKDWNDNGWNVDPAKKGKGSLRFGIDFLCGHRIHIHATKCPNMAREVQTYKRREDKDGNALDEFVEINDDCIAAARYATEYIWGQYHGRIVDNYGAADLGL